MNTQCSRLSADLTVSELLTCWPETVPVFLSHRMACVGCPMSRFETIEGAAAVYGLDLDLIMRELQQIVSKKGDSRMKITEALLRDHQIFYGQFEELERSLQSGTDSSEIQAQLDALSAALETHAQLEDELLFNAMEPHTSPEGPLAVMRMEHGEIENVFSQLEESEDLSTTEGLASHLLEVARQHFAKEEQMLFPMAEQALDPNTLEQLGNQFANRRRVLMI